jgi:hypothetical protein
MQLTKGFPIAHREHSRLKLVIHGIVIVSPKLKIEVPYTVLGVTIQEDELQELPFKELHGHILNCSGSVVDNNSLVKQLSKSNADHAQNGTKNYTAEITSKAAKAQHADAKECDGYGIP